MISYGTAKPVAFQVEGSMDSLNAFIVHLSESFMFHQHARNFEKNRAPNASEGD